MHRSYSHIYLEIFCSHIYICVLLSLLSHIQDCNFPPESVPIGAVGPPLDVFLFPHLPRPIWVHPGWRSYKINLTRNDTRQKDSQLELSVKQPIFFGSKVSLSPTPKRNSQKDWNVCPVDTVHIHTRKYMGAQWLVSLHFPTQFSKPICAGFPGIWFECQSTR